MFTIPRPYASLQPAGISCPTVLPAGDSIPVSESLRGDSSVTHSTVAPPTSTHLGWEWLLPIHWPGSFCNNRCETPPPSQGPGLKTTLNKGEIWPVQRQVGHRSASTPVLGEKLAELVSLSPSSSDPTSSYNQRSSGFSETHLSVPMNHSKYPFPAGSNYGSQSD